MHRGGCEECKRCGIGILLQLAFVTRRPETRFEIAVERMESRCEARPDFGIFDGFGDRGPKHEAATRAAVLRKIDRQRPKALFKDRNFTLSRIMIFAVGFVLLPTLALTSPMLEELLNYPVDTTGYMTIPRGVTLVGTLVLMGFVPARIDSRPFVVGGMALVVYANWRMLGYSPAMDWRAVAVAGLLQGAGLAMSIPALTKAAFATLDPKFRPEGTALFNLSRLYGSTIGIAVVQVSFSNNTQAVQLALAKDLTPYRAVAHVMGAVSRPALVALNEMTTGQAAFVAVID